MRRKNVFVIGLSRRNRAKLESLPSADEYRFHELLPYAEVKSGRSFLVHGPLEKARRRLDAFERDEGPVDGLINYWDFPVTMLTSILARERGLPAPPLKAFFECAHKYWARTIQQRTVPEAVPRFQPVDPLAEDPWRQIEIRTPFWIKPMVGFLSQLGFRIEDERQFERVLPVIRARIGDFGRPLEEILELVDVPGDVAHLTGHHMIAEEIIGGWQCTLEGYSCCGEVHHYGIVDSHRYPGTSVFQRYEYPSLLPDQVQDRIVGLTRRLMQEIRLDPGPFNIEYYWDEESDQLWLLEVNPRMSQSHGDNFEKVDGASNHKVAVELATGQTPRMPYRQGKYVRAAKFMLRHFRDAVVRRAPTPEEVAAVERRFPDTVIDVTVQQGSRLSLLQHQDSYSYLLAELFIGAQGHEELMEKYDQCVAALPFELEDRGEIHEARERMTRTEAEEEAREHLFV